MARPLLVPTAFVTLLGLCPACVANADTPTAAPAATTAPAPTDAAAPTPATPADPAALVVVGSTRAGNARAPSYDDGMIRSKGDMAPVRVVVEER